MSDGTPQNQGPGNDRPHRPCDQQNDDSRRAFSDLAWTYGGSDRNRPSASPADRAEFRRHCEQDLSVIRGDLQAANTGARALNQAAEQGLSPSDPRYQDMLSQVKAGYMKAFGEANAELYDTDKDGHRRIDPITGAAKHSDIYARIIQERRQLNQEINMVNGAVQQNRQLSQTEMHNLGVNSSDAKAALCYLTQQDQMLKDLTRSTGFTQWNLGAFLEVNSGYMTGQQRTDQQVAGQILMEKAAADDHFMLGPPPDLNYVKAMARVTQAANRDAGAGAGPQAGNPGDSQVGQLPQIGQITQNATLDGTHFYPTGNAYPGQPGFADPMQIMAQADQAPQPLNRDTIGAYMAAIQAADNIDRNHLTNDITQCKAIVNQGMSNPQIKAILTQMDNNNYGINQNQRMLAAVQPGIINSGASDLVQMMSQAQSSQQIDQFLADPNNANTVARWQQVPNGMVYIRTMQNLMKENEFNQQLDNQLT
jgi:hypothetical protein